MGPIEQDPFLLSVPKEALLHPLMIEASAGTGKTYTLTRLVLAALVYTQTSAEQLVVITFTRNATAELKDRLSRLLRESLFDENLGPGIKTRLQQIAADFDSLTITTIDAFFQQIYQNSCLETGANPQVRPTYDTTWLTETTQDYFRRYADLLENDRTLKLGLQALMALVKVGNFNNSSVKNFAELLPWLVNNILNNAFLTEDTIYPNIDQFTIAWQREEDYLLDKTELRNVYHELIHRQDTTITKILHSQYQALQATGSLCEILTFMADGPWEKLHKFVSSKKREPFPLLEKFYQLLKPLIESDTQKNPHLAALAAHFLRHFYHNTLGILQEKRELLNLMRLQDPTQYLYQDLLGDPKPLWLKKIRRIYKMAFIDEFQDTNHFQWTILYQIFRPQPQGSHTYALIGDPKQLIYYFRGGTPQTYLQAKQTLLPEQIFALTENYRSHSSVMQAINYWFARIFAQHPICIYHDIHAANLQTPYLKVPQVDKETGITFLYTQNSNQEYTLSQAATVAYQLCVQQIAQLLTNAEYRLIYLDTAEDRTVRPGDITCLVRTNTEGLELKKKLDALRIPSTLLEGSSSIYETDEFNHVLFFLKALAQPFSHKLRHRTLLSPLFGFGPEQLLPLPENQAALEEFYIRFNSWKQDADNRRIAKVFDEIFQHYHYFVRTLQRPDGERCFVNMRHLLSILLREERSTGINSGPGYLYQRLKQLKQQNKKEDLARIRLETDNDAVRILTIHQAKGLEYTIVFGLYGLKQTAERNPDMAIQYQQKPMLDLSLSTTFGQEHLQEINDENLRTFYVLATRAKSHLFLPLLAVKNPCSYKDTLQYLTGQDNTQAILDLATQAYTPFSALMIDLQQIPPSLPPLDREIFDHLSAASLQHSQGFASRILQISSYSSLWQNKPVEEEEDRADESPGYELQDSIDTPETESLTPLNMMGGTALGNSFHAIMEDLPFDEAQKDLPAFLSDPQIQALVESQVARHMNISYHHNREFLAVLKEMIWQSLNISIPVLDGLRLADLPRENKRHEVEFLLHIPQETRLQTPGFQTQVHSGYLRGFLDLVFIYQDHYYVLDWKTTKLGSSLQAYSTEHMAQAMLEHGYDMQARIYLHALASQLKLEKTEIGGALYLFSRGANVSRAGYGLYVQYLTEEGIFNNFE